MRKIASQTMLSEATSTDTSESFTLWGDSFSFQATGQTTAGAGAAQILIEVSNDDSNWMTLLTIDLTLSTSTTSDGCASLGVWKYHRARVASISGTGAAVSVYLANNSLH